MISKAIDGNTSIVTIFGDPIGHSLSPLMHNAAFNALGWNCVYIPCQVKAGDLPAAVRAIKALNFKGANITIPHKQAILQELDEIFGDSILSGSVNTVVNRGGRLLGTSTDGLGFLRSLREQGFDLQGKNLLLLGAGGAARAILYSSIKAGINSLVLVNRDYAKAVDLEEQVWKETGFTIILHELGRLQELPWESFDLVINATSVGLHDDTSLVPARFLAPRIFLYDLVYKKGGTRLCYEAADKGCTVLSGLSLLLYQGVESFRLWFEVDPPVEVMREALNRF